MIEEDHANLIRFGSSSMSPVNYLKDIWPFILERYSKLRADIIPFDNNRITVNEIYGHLGERIDIVATAFDEEFLRENNCNSLKLTEMPLKILASFRNPIFTKEILSVSDLREQTIWVSEGIGIRNYEVAKRFLINEKNIELKTYRFLDFSLLNKCANSNDLVLGIDVWGKTHPLIKSISLDWNFRLPYGFVYPQKPSIPVSRFIEMVLPAIKNLGYNPLL